MKAKHFKPGDRVKTLTDMSLFGIKKGDIGTVEDSWLPDYLMPDGGVMVNFDSRDHQFGKIRFSSTVCVLECDLVPADEEDKQSSVRHIVFDITNDGGEAKYIDGKKIVRKASVKRSDEDEPSDFNAMMYLIGKLFPESKMCVKKAEHDDNVEEDYPDIEGFARFQSPGCGPLYIDINHITSVEYDKVEDGEKVVRIRTHEGAYDVKGYTINEAMTKIAEARAW